MKSKFAEGELHCWFFQQKIKVKI